MFKIIFLFLMLFTVSFAKSIEPSGWGFSFTIPKGWQYQQSDGALILGHNTIAGMIIIYPHNFRDKKTLLSNMKQGLEDDGIYLQLNSKLKKITKKSYYGIYTGFYDMQAVKAKGYGTIAPNGGGAIIIAMSTPQAYSKKLTHAADALNRSIRYQKKPQHSATKSSGNIAQKLIGRWTTMTKYSQTDVYFYRDGTYLYDNESSYGNSDASVGAVWGSAQQNQNRGHWQVQGNLQQGTLIMTDPNGQTSRYPYRMHRENGVSYSNEYYFGNSLYFKQ